MYDDKKYLMKIPDFQRFLRVRIPNKGDYRHVKHNCMGSFKKKIRPSYKSVHNTVLPLR